MKNVHLIAACGVGMASLAGMLKEKGCRVTGSDANVYPPMSTQLEGLGIRLASPYAAGNIPPDAVEAIKREALRAFAALGFRSYGRIDGFYLPDGRILITDPNSASGMAPSSFFFEQAACAGMLPAMIIGRLIENALVIHRRKNGPL